MEVTLDDLIDAARRLPEADRKRLLNILARTLAHGTHAITELRGLGKEIWKDQDAQEYVNQERDAWQS